MDSSRFRFMELIVDTTTEERWQSIELVGDDHAEVASVADEFFLTPPEGSAEEPCLLVAGDVILSVAGEAAGGARQCTTLLGQCAAMRRGVVVCKVGRPLEIDSALNDSLLETRELADLQQATAVNASLLESQEQDDLQRALTLSTAATEGARDGMAASAHGGASNGGSGDNSAALSALLGPSPSTRS